MNNVCSISQQQGFQKQLKYAFIVALLAMMVFHMPAFAQATNPLDGITIVPGSASSSDLGAIIKFFVKLLATALPFVILIFFMSELLIGILASLREARRDGEWGKFFFSLLMMLISLAIAIWVGSMIFKILGQFDSYWTF